jgi:topoisomerase IV subunit B
VRVEGVEIGRFKGLGEMTAQQLWETTMNPDTRRLLPVALGALDERATVDTMTMLMGRARPRHGAVGSRPTAMRSKSMSEQNNPEPSTAA